MAISWKKRYRGFSEHVAIYGYPIHYNITYNDWYGLYLNRKRCRNLSTIAVRDAIGVASNGVITYEHAEVEADYDEQIENIMNKYNKILEEERMKIEMMKLASGGNIL